LVGETGALGLSREAGMILAPHHFVELIGRDAEASSKGAAELLFDGDEYAPGMSAPKQTIARAGFAPGKNSAYASPSGQTIAIGLPTQRLCPRHHLP
jgi:hypothetical protein